MELDCEKEFQKWLERRELEPVTAAIAASAWEAAWETALGLPDWLSKPNQPDSCADGFCPVELFRPVDDTEGSC